jgi:hypothetical protein
VTDIAGLSQDRRTVTVQDILEAYVESGVGVGGKSISIFAYDIFGFAIIITHRIADLSSDNGQRPVSE